MPKGFIDFQISDEELQALRRGLERFRVADHYTADLVSGLVKSQTQQRIVRGGPGPDGQRWPRWSERWRQRRRRLGKPDWKLRFEDHLLQSIRGEAKGLRPSVTASTVYAGTHQFGDAARNIPARPFLGISETNADEIAEVVTGVMAAKLASAVASQPEVAVRRASRASRSEGLSGSTRIAVRGGGGLYRGGGGRRSLASRILQRLKRRRRSLASRILQRVKRRVRSEVGL